MFSVHTVFERLPKYTFGNDTTLGSVTGGIVGYCCPGPQYVQWFNLNLTHSISKNNKARFPGLVIVRST